MPVRSVFSSGESAALSGSIGEVLREVKSKPENQSFGGALWDGQELSMLSVN